MSKRIALLLLGTVLVSLLATFGAVAAPDAGPALQETATAAPTSGSEPTVVVTLAVVTSTAPAYVPTTGAPPMSMSALIIVGLLILIGILAIIAGLALSRRPM